MTSQKEVNLLSIYDVIEKTTDSLLAVSIIVCAFLLLAMMNGDDDDPDGYT